ncbi:MAG TPA: acetoacetate--CoA ligase [Steroidobacteraceae bacterium]|nr:acetoacetate--CoA ligase [Steroidobacteraceae bacterium]
MTIIREGELLWTPSSSRRDRSQVLRYMQWLKQHRGLSLENYDALWRWSITDLDSFWRSIWDYFGVQSSAPFTRVLGQRSMPGAEWFPGARLNYAGYILARERPDATAILSIREGGSLQRMSWATLGDQVRILATQLRRMGVEPGDRVAAVLPNAPQAAIATLASASIGAIWSCCGPDFGTKGVLERFRQLAPKVFIYVDAYQYGGKRYDRTSELREVLKGLDTVQHAIRVPYDAQGKQTMPAGVRGWDELMDQPRIASADFACEQVAFDHPLWILFSSGTTGLPKPIVHGHGGILLEHLKHLHFNYEATRGDPLFFFTTTSWMIWNFLLSSLAADVIPVLYDGNPGYPGADALWTVIEESGATLFGTSPTYIDLQLKAGVVPKERFNLNRLESITLAGSPVSAECMQWIYENVNSDLWVASGSGGTDCCTGFVSGVSILPVYAGEIQARALGCAAFAFDEQGREIIDEVGELVLTQPMPSMPVKFWNDPDDLRYRESYFDVYPGIWRHGDFVRFNQRGGVYVLGRSDSTLNRHGIRIGTAEIYRSLAQLEEVDDALIVNLDLPGGKFFMPLFVKLRGERQLDEPLERRIATQLRRDYSPRHVPDKIFQVLDIPYTLTGKKLEVPIRRILMGADPYKAANRSALRNPAALDYFIDYAKNQLDFARIKIPIN